MCPPAQPPPPEIDFYWSDDQIIAFLAEYTPGSYLPDNVLQDLSPYQYPPSNLPEGIWYLVHSNEKKESAYGFWKARGEACKVYSNATINGWRTTLDYFEGMAPHGKITDWLMQEYGITEKELSDKDNPKESRLLCRVFVSGGHSPKSETNPKNCKAIIESKDIFTPVVSVNPNTDIISEPDSGNESKANREQEVGALPLVDDMEPISPPQDFSELDCLARGDFLELNDLEDPESHSSSSQNSSCTSNLSDEYFDSSAFLRDLEEEENKHIQGQHSSSRYDFSTSVVPNGVVLQPAISGSVISGSVTTDAVEATGTSSTADDSLTDERVKEHATKRHSPESKTESTSNSGDEGAPSTSNKDTVPSGEKKAGPSRMKKLRTYFCFASF